MDLKQEILKYALQNAIRFKGKANPGSILPKILGIDSNLRNDMKSLMTQINEVVTLVNSKSVEEQTKELENIAPEMFEKPKKQEGLKELEDAENGVIMRFAPSPSGPMHIGHAATGGLTALYVKKYGGKFILRIEDTNSDNIYTPAYELLPEDGDWLFGNVSEVWIQSDRMQIYYDYANKLFEKDALYVCTCTSESFKEFVDKKEECPCRKLTTEEQTARWNKLFAKKEDSYPQGGCVVRFKGDMQHKDPAMRDFPLIRINDSEHPRQGLKYRVWPLMNLCVTVDDIEAKMTHIIRAKDHMTNAERQKLIFKVLDKPFPRTYFVGRYNFDGLEISCSKTKARIEAGEFEGWDDIRLPFMQALKRRGYRPEAFLKFTENVGVSPVDKSITGEEYFKAINAYNKDLIDPVSHRYFFIADPIEITIETDIRKDVELDLHPDYKKGGRKMSTNNTFYIDEDDYNYLNDGTLIRFMELFNIQKKNDKIEVHSEKYDDFKLNGGKIIHWIPKIPDLVNVEVLMPNNTTKIGFGEPSLKNIKIGDVVQFERFGFVRLDNIEENVYKFWFTHK